LYFRDAVVPVFVAAAYVAAAHAHTHVAIVARAAHVARVACVAALVNPCDCYINSINKFGPHLTVQNIPCRQ